MRALVCLALLVASPSALAAEPLEQARAAFEGLDFEQAVTLYRQALGRPGTRMERVEAYRGLALSQAYMGQSKAAVASFERLLLLDPKVTVDEKLGPKITGPLEQARKGNKRASLTYSRNAGTGELTVQLREDLPLAKELQVSVRAEGVSSFATVAGPAHLPLTVVTDPEEDVELYAQAVDVNEGVLYLLGSETRPVRLSHPGKPEAAVASAEAAAARERAAELGLEEAEEGGSLWPVWVAVGVAAAAGLGVGGYFLLKPAPEPDLPVANRRVQLELRSSF